MNRNPDHVAGPADATRQPASAWQLARAVAWSFFGVRRRRDHEQASVRIRPIQVIVAGFVGVFVLVAVLMVLVRWVAA